MPSFNVWTGGANAVPDVWTLTPANPEVGDVFTVQINNTQVSYTVTDTTNTVPAVVAALVAQLQSSTIAEFTEVTWAVGTTDDVTTHITATGPSDGKPVTITTSTSDAGVFSVIVAVTTAGSAAVNEKQTITLADTPGGGTFTLTYDGQTTSNLTHDESAADIDTALEALSSIGAGDVSVSGSDGGPWIVEFTGALAGTNVPLITGNGANLTGVATIVSSTTTQGATGTNEVQSITFADESEMANIEWVSQFGVTMYIYGIYGYDTASAVQGMFDVALGYGMVIVTKPSSLVFHVEFTGLYGAQPLYNLMLDVTGTVATAVETAGSSSGTNEVQSVALSGGPTGGTFTLTYSGQTTAAIAYDASAATVQTALEALSNLAPGDVAVTKSGWIYTVTFGGTLASTDVSQITGSGASLTGGSVYVATTQAAADGVNEQQTLTLTNYPTGGTFTLTWDPGGGDETTGNIAYNASAATVKAALEGLATPAPGDFIVTGSDGGPWLVTFTGTYASANVAAMTGDPANLTGGGAQTFVASHATTGTGPNYFNNANNWSAATVPADDEWVVFENSDVDCLYGLSNASTTPEKVIIKSDFTGDIGLPKHTGEYYEYRTTELTIGTNADGSNPILTIEIGSGDGSGSPLVRLNTGTKKTLLIVRNTGSSSEGSMPAVCWRGTHADNAIEAYKGSVGIGAFSGQAATVSTLMIGYVDSQESDASVIVGDQVTLGAVTKSGGTLLCGCACTSLRNDAGTVTLDGSGAVSVLYVYGGTVTSNTSGVLGSYKAITGISQADPGVVTSTAHGLATGDKVRIASVVGMTEVNQREFTVEYATADTFNLVGEDTSGYTAYSSGGYWAKIGSVVVMADGLLDFSKELTARQVAPAIDVYGDTAEAVDSAKRITTLCYGTGEFAVHWHGTTRNANLGRDFVEVRK